MDLEANKVFIGGSRRLTRLNNDIVSHLDRIIESRLPILIGDANGADKAVQNYLCERNYPNVTVFHSGKKYRNNVGNWDTEQVEPPTKKRDYNYYAAKDKRMADEANYGFAIWDGKSKGTLHQIQRLRNQDKKVLVYAANLKRFLKPSDLDILPKERSVDKRNTAIPMKAVSANKSPDEIKQPNLL